MADHVGFLKVYYCQTQESFLSLYYCLADNSFRIMISVFGWFLKNLSSSGVVSTANNGGFTSIRTKVNYNFYLRPLFSFCIIVFSVLDLAIFIYISVNFPSRFLSNLVSENGVLVSVKTSSSIFPDI